jgi:hypothetical protein
MVSVQDRLAGPPTVAYTEFATAVGDHHRQQETA